MENVQSRPHQDTDQKAGPGILSVLLFLAISTALFIYLGA